MSKHIGTAIIETPGVSLYFPKHRNNKQNRCEGCGSGVADGMFRYCADCHWHATQDVTDLNRVY